MISGVNRRAILEELGCQKIPAYLKQVDDDAAETGLFYAICCRLACLIMKNMPALRFGRV
ncbi:hypothetical protein [Keguizhuia sedimenti]|uniref:hypothetical protein n=1 Tax=Keguizhuia sedimenti TaxID=3064264 RepID=UPI003BAE890A